MKKTTVLAGVFSPLFYHFVFYLMLCWEYNEKYSVIQNTMIFVLSALPGIALAVLLIRKSLVEFFKSWGICFLISIGVIFLLYGLRINFMIYNLVTGYEEFSLGDGFLLSVVFGTYIASCFAGCIIAGIVTLCRQIRNKPEQNKVQ